MVTRLLVGLRVRTILIIESYAQVSRGSLEGLLPLERDLCVERFVRFLVSCHTFQRAFLIIFLSSFPPRNLLSITSIFGFSD